MAYDDMDFDQLFDEADVPTPDRIFKLEACLRRGRTVEEMHEKTNVDPWYLDQMLRITEERFAIESSSIDAMSKRDWKRAKQFGFSDAQMAYLWSTPETTVSENEVRVARKAAGIEPTYKTVDTCGAEFDAETPYHYSTWEDSTEVLSLIHI